MRTDSLEKLIGKREAAAAELDKLAAIEPALRADAQKLLNELASLGSDKLVLPPVAGDHFDEATDERLRTLKVLRLKLEVLPGVRANLEQALKSLGAEIAQTTEQLRKARHAEARAQLEAIRAQLTDQFSTLCAGDQVRARKAVESAIEQSEVNRWVKFFGSLEPAGDPAQAARYLLEWVRAFDAGKACSRAAVQAQ